MASMVFIVVSFLVVLIGVSFRGLFHEVEVWQLPGLVEERLHRAVKAEKDFPALAGDVLHPVGFVALLRGCAARLI